MKKTELSLQNTLEDLKKTDFFIIFGSELFRIRNQNLENDIFSKNDVYDDISNLGTPYYYNRIVSSYLRRFENFFDNQLDIS